MIYLIQLLIGICEYLFDTNGFLPFAASVFEISVSEFFWDFQDWLWLMEGLMEFIGG